VVFSTGKADDQVENRPICTGEVLRVHGIYMKERREFDIRVGDQGKLELVLNGYRIGSVDWGVECAPVVSATSTFRQS
jgi:hypothetical protein